VERGVVNVAPRAAAVLEEIADLAADERGALPRCKACARRAARRICELLAKSR
jgi:hypothetical protein